MNNDENKETFNELLKLSQEINFPIKSSRNLIKIKSCVNLPESDYNMKDIYLYLEPIISNPFLREFFILPEIDEVLVNSLEDESKLLDPDDENKKLPKAIVNYDKNECLIKEYN